jgi:hypothetical protein
MSCSLAPSLVRETRALLLIRAAFTNPKPHSLNILPGIRRFEVLNIGSSIISIAKCAEKLFGSLHINPSSSHSTFAFAPHRTTTLSTTRARNPGRSEISLLRHQPRSEHEYLARPDQYFDEVLDLTVPIRPLRPLLATSARLADSFLEHMDNGCYYGVNAHRQIGRTAIR